MNISTDTKKINRRSVLAAIPAFAVASTAAAAPTYHFPNDADPLPQAWIDYQTTTKEWCRASGLPGNGDFDTPEMLEIEARRDVLEDQLVNLAPTSQAGAAAKLSFVEYEMKEGLIWDGHQKMVADVIDYLRSAA